MPSQPHSAIDPRVSDKSFQTRIVPVSETLFAGSGSTQVSVLGSASVKGPYTLNVIVPVASLVAPLRVAVSVIGSPSVTGVVAWVVSSRAVPSDGASPQAPRVSPWRSWAATAGAPTVIVFMPLWQRVTFGCPLLPLFGMAK